LENVRLEDRVREGKMKKDESQGTELWLFVVNESGSWMCPQTGWILFVYNFAVR
jgi:hypothetical protein